MTPSRLQAANARPMGFRIIAGTFAAAAGLMSATATAVDCTPGTMYGAQSDWSTLSLPLTLISDDVDADGNTDLVAVANANAVYVLFGRGDGTFLPPVGRFLSIGFVLSCAVGDLDGDGDLDVVVGGLPGGGSDDLAVLLNNGDRTFADPVYYDLPFERNDVALGDIDGDGDLDLVAVGSASGNAPVVVMFNDGAGGLTNMTNYSGVITGANAAAVAMGDIGNDGDLDFVVTFQDNTFAAYINFGDGVFSRAGTLQAMDPIRAMAFTDFELDGHPDLILASSDAQNFRIYRGRPDGTWFAPTIIPTGLPTNGLAVQDVNGDGFPDLIAAASSTDQCAVFYNDGAGGIGSPGIYPTGDFPESPALGDFDNDGDFDLAYANSGDNGIGVRLNVCIVRPSIATHPVSIAVDEGQPFVLSATLANGTEPLDYQWLRNGTPINDDTRITGSQTLTLTIDPAQPGDSDQYAVQISNDGGTVVSHTAFVAVRGGTGSDCIADLNNDGVLNFFDVQAYLNAFSAGCP